MIADALAWLPGSIVPSEVQAGVSYRVESKLGEGAMGVAFFALRQAGAGLSPVVLKIISPAFVARAPEAALTAVQKEVVALGRLNESVPPSPFVVRLVDSGVVSRGNLTLPWVALEYVHGGVEGTTLEERIQYALRSTGHGFEPDRATRLLVALTEGLEAIHAVGVVHRDIKPNNVLCCGFGVAEVFKVSDFGLARPQGLEATYGEVMLGTPGYAAPEQLFPDAANLVGPHTDVFGLGCTLFHALTGEDYLDGKSAASSFLKAQSTERRSLLEAPGLCAEFRERPDMCRHIDALLARATAGDARQRLRTVRELSSLLTPYFDEAPKSIQAASDRVQSLFDSPLQMSRWSWTVRHPPGDGRVVYGRAWDTDGHCLAATNVGLEFWNGVSWTAVRLGSQENLRHARVIERSGPGEWLIATERGGFSVYSGSGVRDVVHAPIPVQGVYCASGIPADLMVAAVKTDQGSPALISMAARRWMRPLPLNGISGVSSLARLDDDRWLLCGRTTAGTGFAAIYEPMQWAVHMLPTPRTRAFVAASSQPERGIAVIGGAGGITARFDASGLTPSALPRPLDIAATGIDVMDDEWAAGAGWVCLRRPGQPQWESAWENNAWAVPFVSLLADVGLVVAMTADGGVLEGRASWRRADAPRVRASKHP